MKLQFVPLNPETLDVKWNFAVILPRSRYEDMIRDLVGVVTKIATFLGGSAAAIVHDPVRVAEIVKWSSFDTMNQAPTVWFPEQHMYESREIFPFEHAEPRHKLEFLRKGTTRDWVSHMTKRQSDLVDKHHRSMVAGTVAESWWHTEMAYSAQQGNLK